MNCAYLSGIFQLTVYFFLVFCPTGMGDREGVQEVFSPFLILKITLTLCPLREQACYYLQEDLKTNPRTWLTSMDMGAAGKVRTHSGHHVSWENVPSSVCIGSQGA